MATPMSEAWWTVVLVGVATIAIKGAGPVLLGGKPLPPRLGRVIGLLAPALLAALVAISTFGGEGGGGVAESRA
jgi:branched-subunit amino acid transport protein